MKTRGFRYLIGFLSFIVATGLACQSGTTTPTVAPAATSAPATAAGDVSSSSASGDLVTFKDKNSFYAIEIPGNWKHESGTDTNEYWDTFTSPDKNARVENYAYDDGTPWTGGDNGRGALYLLNHVYSYTGKEGDIRVSDDRIEKDGSEKLTWTSKGGGYSGISYFEVRNKTTFLMFTVEWNNDYKDQYIDTLDAVVTSYRVP
jgi:hypothetical protein